VIIRKEPKYFIDRRNGRIEMKPRGSPGALAALSPETEGLGDEMVDKRCGAQRQKTNDPLGRETRPF
jgi:hypothetical protein